MKDLFAKLLLFCLGITTGSFAGSRAELHWIVVASYVGVIVFALLTGISGRSKQPTPPS
jgi:hypothetical protein